MTHTKHVTYRGRFAPSPTGNLHLGSLVAALASYLEARAQKGEWWLRIEDIDPPREIAGASDAIRKILSSFGFEWDELRYQRDSHDKYAHALERLKQAGMIFACTCSRKTLAQHLGETGIYPGTCRDRIVTDTPQTAAWRIKVSEEPVLFHDHLLGPQEFNLSREGGDFIVKRADGFFAYQLATGYDDAEQGMTEVMRGLDLLDSTPRQIYIQTLLGYTPPHYAHLPVLVNKQGQKLSKQTHAPALDEQDRVPQLWQALYWLGQNPPLALKQASVKTLWEWAHTYWNRAKIPSQRYLPLDESPLLADIGCAKDNN